MAMWRVANNPGLRLDLGWNLGAGQSESESEKGKTAHVGLLIYVNVGYRFAAARDRFL
jgi:hypothetical protein